MRSQIATSSSGYGGRRYLPLAFTKHGAIMAASVLNSERAVEVSVYVVRAFVKLHETLAGHQEMAKKLAQLEHRLDSHDEDIHALIAALRNLMTPPVSDRKRIGFRA